MKRRQTHRQTTFVIRKVRGGFRAEIKGPNGATLFKGNVVPRPNRAKKAILAARNTGWFTETRRVGC